MRQENYQFRTKPFKHQLDVFLATADRESYGLFWEQGTGKTKAIIDTASFLYEAGEIDTIIVLAPGGVHRNWITDEVPVHMPQRLAPVVRMDFWESPKAGTQAHQRRVQSVTRHTGLRIYTFNYDAMMTKRGLDALGALVKNHKVLLVADESHYLKTPGAKRTIRGIALGKRCAYRRVLTGTPIANSPFDAYSQIKVLDDAFWKPEFGTFTEFKAYYGIFEKGFNSKQVDRHGNQGREFEHCVGYRRLDHLKARMNPIMSRVTKDDVLDLPPKLYSKRYFEMSTEQARVYREIREESLALLACGDTVTTPLAITKLLRLQQVTCGYVPTDDGLPEFETFGDQNPRLEALCDICDDLHHPAIIWARFRRDIDLIMARLGSKAVRYDGEATDTECAAAKDAFTSGAAQFFVANPAKGAEGLTLVQARSVIYYSNSFRLTHRLQSEDRAHRIGQEHPVHYIDIVAPGTVDDHIVGSLRNKLDIASVLTGDKLKEWL